MSQVAFGPEFVSGFFRMKRLRVFLLPYMYMYAMLWAHCGFQSISTSANPMLNLRPIFTAALTAALKSGLNKKS